MRIRLDQQPAADRGETLFWVLIQVEQGDAWCGLHSDDRVAVGDEPAYRGGQ
jgi:hypothetical protein